MNIGVGLIWLLVVVSTVLLIATSSGLLTHKPKVYVVSLFSNASMLALYYHPGMYGVEYYFLNTLRIIPLMILLVYLACNDRAYNWSYRAMCLIFGLQILTSAWHIWSGLNSPYYGQLSLFATLMELFVITGGCNGKCIRLVDWVRNNIGTGGGNTWAKLHYKEGRRQCQKN